jgi:hypothetical protein
MTKMIFTYSEIIKLFNFAEKHRNPNNIKNQIVTVEENESGIGLTKRVFVIEDKIETEGVYKDITDYSVW